MAKGIKTGGRNFEPGNKMQAKKQKLTEEQLEIKRTIESFNGKLLLAKYCLKSYRELKEFVNLKNASSKNAPCIDLMVARIVERSIAKAEINYLNWIYERLGWDCEEDNNANTKTITLNYKI